MVVPETVLTAFGCTETPVAVDGGHGLVWRTGDIVLKPTGDPAETRWRAAVLDALPYSPVFQVARPVPAAGGDWVADGWEAWRALPGHPDETRWHDVLRVGDAFHRALADLPRPGFLDARDDQWSHGERIAFGAEPIWSAPPTPPAVLVRSAPPTPPAVPVRSAPPTPPTMPVGPGRVLGSLLGRLESARRPISAPSQVVHGDLLGNVLFAHGVRPGIIDWPVYFRPARWASAVVVVDAVIWRDAPTSLLDAYATDPDWYQLLIRALMFRIGVLDGCHVRDLPIYEDRDDYLPTVSEVLTRVSLDRPPWGM
jgi:hypothetical protein